MKHLRMKKKLLLGQKDKVDSKLASVNKELEELQSNIMIT